MSSDSSGKGGRARRAGLALLPFLGLCLSFASAASLRAQDTSAELDPEVVARAVEEYLAGRDAGKTESKWDQALSRLSLYGDFRLRHESSVKRDDQDDRHRERVRLRLGANYQLHPELQVGARLVTGDPDDPNSPHVTLGSGFDSFEVSLDRAFARYTPEWWDGSYAVAGKFAHAFTTNPVYGELVWDQDIQPEGIAAGRKHDCGGWIRSTSWVLGEYLLIEQGNADDTAMTVAQGAATMDLGEGMSSTVAVGYSHYGSTSPGGAGELVGDNQGNQVSGGSFVSKFGILNPIVMVSRDVSGIPVTLSGEFILNVRTGDRKNGWALGIAAGDAKKPGDWRGYYQWQVVEQESVFSPFAQDDFLLATNHRSHVIGAQYRLIEKVRLHLWALASRPDHRGTTPTTDGLTDQWNLRFDIDISF